MVAVSRFESSNICFLVKQSIINDVLITTFLIEHQLNLLIREIDLLMVLKHLVLCIIHETVLDTAIDQGQSGYTSILIVPNLIFALFYTLLWTIWTWYRQHIMHVVDVSSRFFWKFRTEC